MTCRHGAGDPACSSYPIWVKEQADKELLRSIKAGEGPVQPHEYKITEFKRIGKHIVLTAQYPSCNKCSYEGNKVMVFLDTSEKDLIGWRNIDPHFRDPKDEVADGHAPSPAARFPASETGWLDAVAYAETKSVERQYAF